jgi:hypothetical protein
MTRLALTLRSTREMGGLLSLLLVRERERERESKRVSYLGFVAVTCVSCQRLFGSRIGNTSNETK